METTLDRLWQSLNHKPRSAGPCPQEARLGKAYIRSFLLQKGCEAIYEHTRPMLQDISSVISTAQVLSRSSADAAPQNHAHPWPCCSHGHTQSASKRFSLASAILKLVLPATFYFGDSPIWNPGLQTSDLVTLAIAGMDSLCRLGIARCRSNAQCFWTNANASVVWSEKV